MSQTTSATISIVAPHDIQAEIHRLFRLPIEQMRQELGGDANDPVAGQYLRPEFCIDHLNLYYIDREGIGTWRTDLSLVAKRFPEAQIYYKEMHDEGKSGACTNDAEARFFMPYVVMVDNHGKVAGHEDVDLPALRRCSSEIWTKQTEGFHTQQEAEHFLEIMHKTFPDLSTWINNGNMDVWITHFETEDGGLK